MTEKIRVLRIITRMNIGGPAIHAALLANRLDPARFCTRLVVGEPDSSEGDLSALVRPGEGVEMIRLRWLRRRIHPWQDLRAFVSILRICWNYQPDLIHTHMAKAGSLGRAAGWLYNLVGRLTGARRAAWLIHTFHGHVLEGYFSGAASRLFAGIERWLARRTDCLIAVSPTIRQAILAKGIGLAAQVRVIRLGLDLAELGRLDLPNGHRPLRCGLVGRLVPIKNPSLFVQGLDRASRALPPGALSGAVVGDGPLKRDVEAQVAGCGAGDWIRLTGWRRDLAACYGGLDLVCITSWNEGTPVSVIEAMAAGRAVIATDVGGVRDLLQDPDDAREPVPAGGFALARRGILVNPGDAAGLSAALIALSGDAPLRQRLGESARAYALDTYQADRLICEVSELYEELMRLGNRRTGDGCMR